MKQYVNLFKALDDETRLRIMVLLSKKELCVCEIETALRSSQVKVSRHLTVLRSSGLVATRREGTLIYYSILEPKNCLEEKIFSCFKNCLRKEEYFRKDLSSMKSCIPKSALKVARRARKS
ncbi:MAG: metalloregulator ArsR/SmtB family transcription factor [Candidatus Omnitrophica bacterium]|nr:metalloregulator ArsR/SmtB family transcription factor [Candidatus Omnitrophota bacterium]